jgi:hypothetical protein
VEKLTSLTYGHLKEAHLATFEFILCHCPKRPLLLHVREKSEGILPIWKIVEKWEWSSKVVWGIVSLDAVYLLKKKTPAVSILAFIPSPGDIVPLPESTSSGSGTPGSRKKEPILSIATEFSRQR